MPYLDSSWKLLLIIKNIWVFIGEDFCKEDRKAVFRKKDSKSPLDNIRTYTVEIKNQ